MIFHDKCPICSHSEIVLISEKDRTGLPVNNYICEGCGVIFKNPVLNKQAAVFHYQNISALLRGKKLDSLSIEQLFYERVERFGRPRYQFVLSNISKIEKTEPIVEVGCYDGANLLPWKEAGYQTIGIDIDTSSFSVGRSKGLELIEGTLETLLSMNLRSAKLLILSHVIEHLTDPRDDLDKIRRIIAPDGFLFIELPGIRGNSGMNLLSFMDVEHNFSFDLYSLTRLLAMCHFERLYGDEFIRAVFRPSSKAKLPQNRSDLLGFLDSIERSYRSSLFRSCYQFKLFLMNYVMFPIDDIVSIPRIFLKRL